MGQQLDEIGKFEFQMLTHHMETLLPLRRSLTKGVTSCRRLNIPCGDVAGIKKFI
jgi:hypothetical protein